MGSRDGPVRPTGLAPRSLRALIAGFKAASAARVNRLRGAVGQPVWQRNYHERVVRSEDELARIRAYIASNPERRSARRDDSLAAD